MAKNYTQPHKRLLDYFIKAIGLPIKISPDPSISSWAKARYIPQKDKCVIIKYDPEYQGILDYLTAHEATHILRFTQAPPEERKLPVVTPVTRRAAFERMSNDFHPLAKEIFDSEFLWDTLHDCYNLLLDKLINTPMDIRIDKWLYENFPYLRDTQVKASREEIAEFHESLKPFSEKIYPAFFNLTKNAIEFAFAKFISELYSDESLLQPYCGTEYEKLGNELYSLILNQDDEGYAGDIEMVDQWAEKLDIKDWYKWKAIDRL